MMIGTFLFKNIVMSRLHVLAKVLGRLPILSIYVLVGCAFPLIVHSESNGNNGMLKVEGTIKWVNFISGNWDAPMFTSVPTEFTFWHDPESGAYALEAIVQRQTRTDYYYVASDGIDVFQAWVPQPHNPDSGVDWHVNSGIAKFTEGRFPSEPAGDPVISALLVALHTEPFWLIYDKYHTFPIGSVVTGGGLYDFEDLVANVDQDDFGRLLQVTFLAPQRAKRPNGSGETWLLPDGYAMGYHAGNLKIVRDADGMVRSAIYERGLPHTSGEPEGPEDTRAFNRYEYVVQDRRQIESQNPLATPERVLQSSFSVSDERELILGWQGYPLNEGDAIPFRGSEQLMALQRLAAGEPVSHEGRVRFVVFIFIALLTIGGVILALILKSGDGNINSINDRG